MNGPLFINIGNTHTQLAVEEGGRLRLLSVYDTSRMEDSLPELEDNPGIEGFAVCVVPPARRRLEAHYGGRMHFLDWHDFRTLDFSLVDTSTLGMDRIANAAAAFDIAKGPAIVVDCGTCVNTVVVDGRGRFLGGAILPGRNILRRGLHSHTAQLPLLELRDEVPPPIGRNTRDAIAAGTDLASVGALREVLSRTLECLPEKHMVYATGGDAPYFLRALPGLLVPAPGHLTLHGVRLAAFGNLKNGVSIV